MIPTLMIATGNLGKLSEFQDLLDHLPLKLLSAADLENAPYVMETGSTYAENAALKAHAFAAAAGTFALADDSGLEVDALEGAPGLHSARIAGPGRSDLERRQLLLQELRDHSQPWTARFRCAAALASPDGALWASEGTCEGVIIPDERGEHGFGYDPIFYLEDVGATMAELARAQKNTLSHRALATKAMLPTLMRVFEFGS